jgi:hypothetical protein
MWSGKEARCRQYRTLIALGLPDGQALTRCPHEQADASTVPLAVIRGSNKFEEFWCNRCVNVSHSVKMSISFPNKDT